MCQETSEYNDDPNVEHVQDIDDAGSVGVVVVVGVGDADVPSEHEDVVDDVNDSVRAFQIGSNQFCLHTLPINESRIH